MMEKSSVLFLCSGNSARSQMAEALLRHTAGERFEAHSAGMDPRGVHPLTHRVLGEVGIDSSGLRSKSVKEFLGKRSIQVAIILCEQARQGCPSLYPFALRVLYWPFEDPVAPELEREELLERFRAVRDSIGEHLQRWCAEERGAAPERGRRALPIDDESL